MSHRDQGGKFQTNPHKVVYQPHPNPPKGAENAPRTGIPTSPTKGNQKP
jgi:hypothetical protein